MKKIIAAGFTILLTACSSIPVDVQQGQFDASYDFGAEEKKNNLQIAIISPNVDINRSEDSALNSQIFGNLLKQKNKKRTAVHQKYLNEVNDAFQSGFESLITKRGFSYSGPYSSFDEITYRDKKKSYLAVIPSFKIDVAETNVTRESFSSYIEEKGNISVDGTLTIKMIEPLTKQVISQKRIDLHKLNINEPYLVQQEKKSNGDLVALAIDSAVKGATAPEKLVVTYDKAYADAMSKFYLGTMQQLSKYVSTEEILDYQSDIRELKSIKRF